MDTALLIASFLPPEDTASCRRMVRSKIEEAQPDENEMFPLYLEAFAAMDLDALIKIIHNGERSWFGRSVFSATFYRPSPTQDHRQRCAPDQPAGIGGDRFPSEEEAQHRH